VHKCLICLICHNSTKCLPNAKLQSTHRKKLTCQLVRFEMSKHNKLLGKCQTGWKSARNLRSKQPGFEIINLFLCQRKAKNMQNNDVNAKQRFLMPNNFEKGQLSGIWHSKCKHDNLAGKRKSISVCYHKPLSVKCIKTSKTLWCHKCCCIVKESNIWPCNHTQKSYTRLGWIWHICLLQPTYYSFDL